MRKSKNKTITMWKIINQETNKTNTIQKENIKLRSNNTLVESPYLVADMFNKFFASVGANTAPKSHRVKEISTNSMYLQPVSEQEVFNIIRKLPNKYSYGIDDIPPILIKNCINELTPPITTLINQSFVESVFPEKLKIAVIKPVLKKGGKSEDPSNYRPIALLPSVSKIFEKVMANRLYSFLEKFNLFDKNQFGFRKNSSTTLAVYKYMQHILDYIKNKNYAVGLLLDMSKAYDKVCHTTLLTKLHGMGIRGCAYEWLKSYLANRKQCVQIRNLQSQSNEVQNVMSNTITTNWSIPQGSVIGCILFIIYINDLPKISLNPCILFADDVSLLFECSSSNNSINRIQETFNDVKTWLSEHNLEINCNKTKLIQFRPHQKQPLNLSTVSTNLNITEVNEFTLLGITIDTHINWQKHTAKIKTKISRFVYALGILKRNTHSECAKSAYFAYVHAWLQYGIILWGHSPGAHDLFILQKKCLRIIVNIRQRQSCRPFFIKENILTVPCIYILETVKFVRKHKYLYEPVKSARRETKLVIPEPKMEIFKNSPYYRSIQIYNKLPDNLLKEENYLKFCNKLKKLLLQKCYYSIEEYMLDKITIDLLKS